MTLFIRGASSLYVMWGSPVTRAEKWPLPRRDTDAPRISGATADISIAKEYATYSKILWQIACKMGNTPIYWLNLVIARLAD